MSWLRRKRDEAQESPAEKVENPRMITTRDEISRAERAAELAALHLEEARNRRPRVEEVDEQLRKLNRQNGFAELIRQAFGS